MQTNQKLDSKPAQKASAFGGGGGGVFGGGGASGGAFGGASGSAFSGFKFGVQEETKEESKDALEPQKKQTGTFGNFQMGNKDQEEEKKEPA